MAHFAELDENNIVLRVIVVENKDICDENGNEKEAIGQAHCARILGGRWLQASYNGSFRKNFAGKGDSYDPVRDAFIAQKPEKDGFIFDEETCRWYDPEFIPFVVGVTRV
tara:strand:- start:468 stop:797 length:330 start_codon:yes stop_codon:yes gene_type:complete